MEMRGSERLRWRVFSLLLALVALASLMYNSPLHGLSRQCATPRKQDRLVNTAVFEYEPVLKARFQHLVEHGVPARHPDLVGLIREMLDPPATHMIKLSRPEVATPQTAAIMDILHNKEGGFFVEAGGFDGERSSNTLYLEQKLGWTGLLVEMDPYFYTQLRGKNRKSWSINACISPKDHPTMMDFVESPGSTGALTSSGTGQSVPCFPLESMLLALNRSHVDYFSLDVEGYELDILGTITYDLVDITAMSVEYIHGKRDKSEYRAFMESKGYKVYKDIQFTDTKVSLYVSDFIFVKNDAV